MAVRSRGSSWQGLGGTRGPVRGRMSAVLWVSNAVEVCGVRMMMTVAVRL